MPRKNTTVQSLTSKNKHLSDRVRHEMIARDMKRFIERARDNVADMRAAGMDEKGIRQFLKEMKTAMMRTFHEAGTNRCK